MIMKSKITTSILIVVIVIIAVVGITFAYITWTSGKINTTGNSECFNVLYAKGTDIGSDQNTATLMPSNDYTGGLSSTVKIGFSSTCTNVSGTGIIKLNTLDTTSSNLYRTGLLNYQVVKDGTATNLKGNITKSGEIALDIGTLTKASSASTTYKIYVWVDKEVVINSDANSKYYGKIRATATQGK